MSVVMEISDHVVVLEYGQKISDGSPDQVRNDPRVIAAYLGVDDDEVEQVLATVEPKIVEPELPVALAKLPPKAPVSKALPLSKERRAAMIEAAPVKLMTKTAVKPTAKPVAKAQAKIVSKAAPKPALKAAVKAEAKAVAAPLPNSGGVSNALSAPRGGKADDLLKIKGIGPVNQRKLNEHGIYHFDQIGTWKKADIKAAEVYLAFDGRIAREDWMTQAKGFAKAAKEAAKVAAKAPAKAVAIAPVKTAKTKTNAKMAKTKGGK
jgi:branched-chain amino acid transport system ATP-binding protein